MRRVGVVFGARNAVVTADVTLAAGVNLWYGVVIRGDVAPITLCENVNLQDGVIVHCDAGVPQVMEAGVVAGHAAVLHGKHVGADTLIGIGAKLLSETAIGPECVIAAGTVIPPGVGVSARALVLGGPRKIVSAVN